MMEFNDAHASNPWCLIREIVAFSCRHFDIRADIVSHGDSSPRSYNSVRMKYNGVHIVPIDDEGWTTLVGQYRYVLDRYTWEVPAGGARHDAGALDAAKAELSEETGIRAHHWLKVIDGAVCPGMTDEISPGFVAWGVHQGVPHPDPEESLSRRRLPFSDAVEMALRGEISSLAGVALLLSIQLKLQRDELPGNLARLLKRA